jgi:hypothetical protein
MRYTNNCNIPESIADAIKKNTYDVKRNDPKIISITTLINAPRVRQLTIRHWDEIEEDVADGIWRLLGSSVHSVMDRIKQENRFIEERLTEEVNGVFVTGKADLYEGATEGIEDYKVTSVYKVKNDVKDWETQLNSYAWFYRKIGFNVKKIQVNAILRDWRKGESKRQKEYPSFAFKQIDIPLWTFEKQDNYIRERVKIHLEAQSLEDKDLPLCTEEERWCNAKKKDVKCKDYCTVKSFCNYWAENYEKKV